VPGTPLGEPQHAAETQVLRQPIVDFGEMLEADPAFAINFAYICMTMSLSSA